MTTLVAFDTETFPICDDHVIPPIVCLSYALRVDGELRSGIAVAAEPEELRAVVSDLLTDPSYILVGHNAAYDMGVILKAFPEFAPQIFAAYAEGRVRDTKIAEKEWRVSTSGDTEYEVLPNGQHKKLSYSLSSLEQRHLGRDRTADKGENSWRLNYQMLVDKPLSQWPDEAVGYALDDAIGTLEVHEAQLRVIRPEGPGSINSHDIDVAADFGLFLMTDKGMASDAEHWHRMKAWLLEELSPENMRHLLDAGVLRPAQEGKPKGKAKTVWTDPEPNDLHPDMGWAYVMDMVETESRVPAPRTKGGKISTSVKSRNDYYELLVAAIPEPEEARGWQRYFMALRSEEHSGATTKPKKESINQKKLREIVAAVCAQQGQEPALSDKTQEPSLALENIEHLAPFSPVIEDYVRRMKVNKLVTTELPRMCFRDEKGDPIDGQVAPVIHFNFDVVKETFRTSSFAGDLYASANGQNVDPRARGMYVARPGHVLCSVDYSALELVSLANKLEELFGHSVLADLIRSGIDPHAYLGSQLAYTLDTDFCTEVQGQGITAPRDIYELFMRAKTHDSEDVRKWFKHYRTFAKPTGLGYPGGLGPQTFVSYAYGTFGISVDVDTAKMLREVWLNTFPEMRQFFDWVKSNCKDPRNETIGFREKDGSPIAGFCYTAPGGAFRAGCPFTACCNGVALQSPSALGAKIAVFDVQRACYDPSRESVLYGTSYGVDFVHDEIIAEFPDDDLRHDRAMEIARLMVDAMAVALPLVPVAAEPALMYRWDKFAEPVYQDGRLIPWSPDGQ